MIYKIVSIWPIVDRPIIILSWVSARHAKIITTSFAIEKMNNIVDSIIAQADGAGRYRGPDKSDLNVVPQFELIDKWKHTHKQPTIW